VIFHTVSPDPLGDIMEANYTTIGKQYDTNNERELQKLWQLNGGINDYRYCWFG
jgi:hypothetical protein